MWYDKLYYFAVLERGFFLMSSPKLTVAVLFGGASTEHDVSQLSVTSVLRELDRDKYELLPVGITRSGNAQRFRSGVYRLVGASGTSPSDFWLLFFTEK